MPTGKVKFWNQTRGFGFAEVAGRPDMFIHASALPPGIEELSIGDKVEFNVVAVIAPAARAPPT